MPEKLTTAEQLTAFQTKRQSAIDKQTAIMAKANDEGRTLDESEGEEYDGLGMDIKAIDTHIERLKGAAGREVGAPTTIVVPGATALPGTETTSPSSVQRAGNVISVARNLPKGTAFTRFAIAMAAAKGNIMLAREIAEHRYPDTPEVKNVLNVAVQMGSTATLNMKAAVAAGTTSNSTWAQPLVQYNDMESEFIELARPAMILGRMNSLRRVPFMMRTPRQTSGVSGAFVGEGAPKPVQKPGFDTVTLGFAKAAVIVVMTDELVRFSSPSAEALVRDDMVKGVSTYLDRRFIDSYYSGTPGVSPASITNAARRIQSSGSTLAAIDADVASAFTEFTVDGIDPATAVWVMSAATALKLSMKRNTNDELAFPDISMTGGTWYGLPVITSSVAGSSAGSPGENQIALITQNQVFLADDGGFSIDMSQEASLEMNDAPSGGATSLVSLWQNNLIGIRAERYINWAPRQPNSNGIAVIENVAY